MTKLTSDVGLEVAVAAVWEAAVKLLEDAAGRPGAEQQQQQQRRQDGQHFGSQPENLRCFPQSTAGPLVVL